MFAPNADQMHVVNHCAGKPTEEKRNILQESARIARGDVTDLVELNVSEFDAVIIPGKPATLSFSFSVLILLLILPVSGGFGAAKNLCDWAVKSKNCAVQPDIEKLIKAFHKPGKPLGMCCISPVLAAKVLPGCELTVGHDKECDKYVNPFNTISTWGGARISTGSSKLECFFSCKVAVRPDSWSRERDGLQTCRTWTKLTWMPKTSWSPPARSCAMLLSIRCLME